MGTKALKNVLDALRAEHDRLETVIADATKKREAIRTAAAVLAGTDAQTPASNPKNAVATPKNPKAWIFVDDAVVADADRMMRAGSTWSEIIRQTRLTTSLIARLQREGRVYKRQPGEPGSKGHPIRHEATP